MRQRFFEMLRYAIGTVVAVFGFIYGFTDADGHGGFYVWATLAGLHVIALTHEMRRLESQREEDLALALGQIEVME